MPADNTMIIVATASAVVAALALLLNFIVQLRSGAFNQAERFQELKTLITETSNDLEVKVHGEMNQLRADTENKVNSVGEVYRGMREKITQVELYIRDNYVDKQYFLQTQDQNREMMKQSFDLLNQRLGRIENLLTNVQIKPPN